MADREPRAAVAFDEACALLEQALRGSLRRDLVAVACAADTNGEALARLRHGMRTHAWKGGPHRLNLARVVGEYDRRTRADGFHALNDWDGVADAVNADIIPVDVLNYLIERRGGEAADATAAAILLDYYFFHLLSLLSLRIFDEGDAGAHLERLNGLVSLLQGPDGSGQPFVADAETLMLVATSHFELVERGYASLLARVRTLNRQHRLRIAIGHGASIGSHLRFGFEATYARDTVATRQDNVADYPWLCFALATLMEEYARLHDAGTTGAGRDAVVEALLNGLTPDARAFVGAPPASLSASEAERAGFRDRFLALRADLLAEFEPHVPSAQAYSPLAFFFNFSHNVLKGTVVDALLRGEAWRLTFNDLLTSLPRPAEAVALQGEPEQDLMKRRLAETLMGHARANPHKIRGQLMPVIVYDPDAGRRAFRVAMGKLRE